MVLADWRELDPAPVSPSLRAGGPVRLCMRTSLYTEEGLRTSWVEFLCIPLGVSMEVCLS